MKDQPRPVRADQAPVIHAGTPARRHYVEEAIYRECFELAHTGEGDRNNRLNVAAFSLARFIETGEADPGALTHALTLAASHAGLASREIERTIESAFHGRRAIA